MKKLSAVIAALFLVVMVAGNSLAEMDDERFAGVSTTELKTVKEMVAGTYSPDPETLRTARDTVVDLGFTALTQSELDELKNMIAGSYVPSPEKAQNFKDDVVNIGKVEMTRREYESLKKII
jgi:hypothetical protein